MESKIGLKTNMLFLLWNLYRIELEVNVVVRGIFKKEGNIQRKVSFKGWGLGGGSFIGGSWRTKVLFNRAKGWTEVVSWLWMNESNWSWIIIIYLFYWHSYTRHNEYHMSTDFCDHLWISRVAGYQRRWASMRWIYTHVPYWRVPVAQNVYMSMRRIRYRNVMPFFLTRYPRYLDTSIPL